MQTVNFRLPRWAALFLILILLLTTFAGAAQLPVPQQSDYETCLIGSPAIDAYDPETLRTVFGRTCLLPASGADPTAYRTLAQYAVEQLDIHRLVLHLDLASAAQWSTEESEETRRPVRTRMGGRPRGVIRQQRVRDLEKIGDPRAYDLAHQGDFTEKPVDLSCWEACVCAVSDISRLCSGSEVELIVICGPVWEGRWKAASRENLEHFKRALAQVTDYWDFSHSALSFDNRYFYNADHFRRDVGDMILARIAGRQDRYIPADFGLQVTAHNVDRCLDSMYSAEPDPEQVHVPTLMYHHLAERCEGKTVLSVDRFEHQMAMLAAKGYEAVSLQQMLDYVRLGTPLPEKPVCITFDDGYRSNYEYAYPILKKYGLKGTIFAIGWSMGLNTYKNTDNEILDHFDWAEAREMQASGVMDIQSHTYDMHQWAPFETVPEEQCRLAMRRLPGESGADFQRAVERDLARYAAIYKANSLLPLIGLAYPTGAYNEVTELLVHGSGIPVTFSIKNDQRNILVRGLDQSLYALCRLDVTPVISDSEILEHLSR